MIQRTRWVRGLLVATFTCASVAAFGQTEKQAEDFVRQTFQRYETMRAKGPDYTGKLAPLVFTPSLIQLIRRDQKGHPGEIGKLDADPICDCQDWNHLTVSTFEFVKESATNATVSFIVRDSAEGAYSLPRTRWHLVWLTTGWKIDDLETRGIPSLRKFLQ